MTSRKLIFTILVLLTATSLVTACGQKERTQQTTTKTNSSVNKTKDKTDDKTKESQSKTDVQTKEQSKTVEQETTKPETAQENKKTQTAAVQTKPENQTEAASVTTTIPDMMLGTWTGVSPQAPDVSMTITAEGYVMTQATFSDTEGLRKNTAKITQVRYLGNNYYLIEAFSDDFSALTPGITGLGGIGKSAVGFYIVDNQLTPVSWFAALDQEIDYSKPQAFNFSLTRQ